jgi:hypothetical protein
MEIKNDIMAKLGTFEKAVKVIWYIMWVIGIIAIILVCSDLFTKGTLQSKDFGLEFTVPGLKMKVGSSLLGEFYYPAFMSMMINIVMIWTLLLYSVNQFLKIIKSIKVKGTPFVDSTIKKIKGIAFSFFLYSIVAFIISIILKIFFAQDSAVAGLDAIRLQINTEIPFWSIVCGIFILVIAEIFNYGLKLQQDNDSII